MDVFSNREELFKEIQWESYRSQLKNRIWGSDLYKYFNLTESEKYGIKKNRKHRVGCTPYYLNLSDPNDPNCPIRKMIVPTQEETVFLDEESMDPLHEERLSPVKGLVHMYPDRVLVYSNYECSVYCRHCMRFRKVSDSKNRMEYEDLKKCFVYIKDHPEISDVVISGGDPLNLSDEKIAYILSELHQIAHVKIARIGTRIPVVLPFRLDKKLCSILEKYNDDKLSIFCNTHFNHPKECTQESKSAILNLLKAGISVGNQCVILKGINDSGPVMLELHQRLLEMRVRAYYMYDPELVPGSRSFRTPLYQGIEILKYMRGKISGMGIPHFVNDLPGGGGKVTFAPNWYVGFEPSIRKHSIRSAITGKIHHSIEPEDSPFLKMYPILKEDVSGESD